MLITVLAAVATSFAWAGPARIVHQTTDSIIVRMTANASRVVWQEVGNKKSENYLYAIDPATGAKSELKSPKRPFGPSIAGDHVIYGAGKLHQKIEVYLHDLKTGKARMLHKQVPWIVEPAMQLVSSNGSPKLQAVWERSADDNGSGLAIYLWEGAGLSGGSFRILADGPVLRKADIPKDYHRHIRNEYPEIDGDSVVFQNNEFGTPQIYRLSIGTGAVSRLSPSLFHQERPAVAGPYTAWEESERGYSESYVSSVFAHDARTGAVKKLNQQAGFHYQIRLFENFAIYGAKREPAPSTPSIRIYDLTTDTELEAQKCFPGAIFDYAATPQGVYAAQRFNSSSSRLLFASWEQLRAHCY